MDQNTIIVGEAIAGESHKTRKAVEKLIQKLTLDQYDIGDLLWKIKKNGWYTQWGFNTFAEYTKSTGLKESKARYLPQISEVMEAVGIGRAKYEAIGIAKLRAIASLDASAVYVNPVTKVETAMSDFISGITEKAITEGDGFTLDEIKSTVRTLKGIVGDNDITFLGVSVQRTVLESVIRPALERAKAIIGSVGKDEDGVSKDATDAAALAAICADFLATPDPSGPAEPVDEPAEG